MVGDSRRSDIESLAAKREPGTNLPATEYHDLRAIEDERRTFVTTGSLLMIGGGGELLLVMLPNGESSSPDHSLPGRFGPASNPYARRTLGPRYSLD
jgi:hypothetical protein